MKNGLFLIHIDDFVHHVEREATMYRMAEVLIKALKSKLNPATDFPLLRGLSEMEEIAETTFRDMKIPESFFEDGDPAKLARLISDELSIPEEAGYIDSADLTVFGVGGWPDTPTTDNAAEDSAEDGNDEYDDLAEYVLRRMLDAAIGAVLDKLLEGVEE